MRIRRGTNDDSFKKLPCKQISDGVQITKNIRYGTLEYESYFLMEPENSFSDEVALRALFAATRPTSNFV